MSYELLKHAEGALATASNAMDDFSDQSEADPGKLIEDALLKIEAASRAVQAIFNYHEDLEKSKDFYNSPDCP